MKLSYKILILITSIFFISCTEDPITSDTKIVDAYHQKYRPQIHFSSKYNWINDPNGLVYFDGEYHLFFQHNPFGSNWGYMSWGHAVSTDMIHWTQLDVALKPDANGDIFSGSIVIDKNNTAGFGANAMVAIYTSAGSKQTQSIAFSTDKGRKFIKFSGNPVLPNPNKGDFRDPKVFWHEDSNQWVMALATGQTMTLYKSSDLKTWTMLSEFGNGIGSHAGVWECPDLFPLKFENETKWVLLVSINPGGPSGGSAMQYFIGNFDGSTFKADNLAYPLWLDYGRDNYAGVTWNNIPETDGRKMLIAWMNNWDYAGDIPRYSTGTNGSRSGMTLPRELSLSKNASGNFVLKNKVIREFDNYASSWTDMVNEDLGVEKSYPVNMNQDKAYQLNLQLNNLINQDFILSLKNDSNEVCQIQLDNLNKKISFSRNNSGQIAFNNRFIGGSVAPAIWVDNLLTIDVYVDQSSVEVFVNDGLVSITNLVFPKSIYNKLSILPVNGTLSVKAKYRSFKSIW